MSKEQIQVEADRLIEKFYDLTFDNCQKLLDSTEIFDIAKDSALIDISNTIEALEELYLGINDYLSTRSVEGQVKHYKEIKQAIQNS